MLGKTLTEPIENASQSRNVSNDDRTICDGLSNTDREMGM